MKMTSEINGIKLYALGEVIAKSVEYLEFD